MSSETASDEAGGIAAGPPATAAHALANMLDLTQASHLRDEMLRLAGEPGIVLDAAGVERMSTPCAQILLAAGRTARASEKSFKITNASEVFRTAITDLGLQAEFGNWME
jgi:chemotaxis protein CheX